MSRRHGLRGLVAITGSLVIGVSVAGGRQLDARTVGRSVFAEVHILLAGCLHATRAVPVIRVVPHTLEVTQMNRLDASAQAACGIAPRIGNLAEQHPNNKLLAEAYSASEGLELGVGLYRQYLVDVAFGQQDSSLLTQAQNLIPSGKQQAIAVLAKLPKAATK
jgi:hypothetical protein